MAKPVKSAEELVTVGDFFRMVPDGQKADLLDGVIYMASPDSIRSNDLTGFVEFLLRGFNSARKIGGRVFVNRVAYRLSKHRAPEPDVGYVVPERLHLIKATIVKGGPDIAVEIVSADSIDRDYKIKKRTYRQAGVSEYWIIDPIQRRVQFWRLKDKAHELVVLENGTVFHSHVLPGFWLDVRWLLADTLPEVYECLQMILQSA